MKALEISPENLEDLLTYDDLFLDYFNAFLALPVFPQALAYNRLTGAFEEVPSPYNTTVADSLGCPSPASTLPYGATDAVRENMLQWAREERLPLFLSTQLFRELKLCKLLLRPLDDRNSASRGSSRQIRGYSRQSESYISSLSYSGENSAEDEGLDEDINWADMRYQDLFRYRRPGSKAYSDPIRRYLASASATETIKNTSSNAQTSSKYTDTRTSAPFDRSQTGSPGTNKRGARISSLVKVIPDDGMKHDKDSKSYSSKKTKGPPVTSSTEAAFLRGSRVLSAPVNYEDFIKMPFFHFDALLREEPAPTGDPYVTFNDDDAVSEAQTETDVRNMEGRLKMTIQQMKEQVIATYVGMESFKEFLKDTAGVHLLNFWLDCEYFKDSMEDYDEEEFIEIRNCLFRDIQDKYKLNLTNDAKDQITRAARNVGLTHTIFLRTQYDVLRRLRAYWISRFLMHFERQKPMSEEEERDMVKFKVMKPAPKNSLPFFPSISLVHSMPVWPDDAFNQSRTSSWDMVNSGNILRDITSARGRRGTARIAPSRSTKDRLIVALSSDRLAGGPFKNYLDVNCDYLMLSNLLFWQDVTEYSATEDKSADRLLRLRHAWSIYTNYISEDSQYNVDPSEKERNNLHQLLSGSRDFVEASVFDTIKDRSIVRLEKAWIRFLKDDLKIFLDCRIRPGRETPPSTAEAIEISVTGADQDILVIKRPRPWVRRLQPLRVPGSTQTERGLRLNKSIAEAEEIDFERLAEIRKKNKEKRKEAERERKRAVRAAYARQKEAKLKKPPSRKKSGIEEEEDVTDKGGKLPTFQDMFSNKQMMILFKKYISEFDIRDVSYMVGLYQDIETYFNNKDGKSRKDMLANNIHKAYFDNQSRRHVPMPEKIIARLGVEKDRPRTATLRDAQRFVLGKVEETYKDFLNHQADELGIDPVEMLTMSPAELTMRMGSDAAMLTSWNKRSKVKGKEQTILTSREETSSSLVTSTPKSATKRRKRKQTGRAQPTKNDMAEFISALSQSASGQLPLEMLYFYTYLVKHGEEDNMPLVDKDLFFYIEVQKFKDCSHAFSDDEMLKRKVQSIIDCFLESVYTPSLQVDVQTDVQQKIMKSSQRYMNGKELNPSIFDEAQMMVLKELLPYWAGFKKNYKPPDNPDKKPVTKIQKMLRKRLENIENYQIPSANLKLPAIPEGATPAFSLSLADGIKFREIEEGSIIATPMPADKMLRGRRTSIAPSLESTRTSRKHSSQDTHSTKSMIAAR
ncbi:hypothetical protein SNE40_011001 [Patella caerulea]|uniref:RGS domain-containing protein n=1 Tax=Patella caerulea TaxID=87958 RepID=A0AAN8JVH1_PATCE